MVLEQLVVLTAAQDLAGRKGLTIGRADIDREYDRFLRRLIDPLSRITTGPLDRETAERLLKTVLVDRNMSRAEFMMGIRRNALLRAIVESDQRFTEEELREEFERAYSERIQVRHIQLGTPAEASRVAARLAAGEDFSELARKNSANFASARTGGLLDPFSRNDPNVPELLRSVAFGLTPGEVSDSVRVGSWYHLLKLEKHLPARDREFTAVGDELRRRLRDRATEPEMERLYEQLFREARVEIHDPVLHQAFLQAFPNHAGQR